MSGSTIGMVARRMRPWLWAGVALMAVVLVVVASRKPATAPGMNPGADDAAASAEVAKAIASMTIPEFRLVDQTGQYAGRDIFKDRWTILDFGFSYCTMACPVLKQNLATAVHELRDTPVRMVTISVDPVHDTPLRLRAYADEMDIDLARWTFLTESGGDAGEVRKIAVNSLGFMLDEDPANQIHKPDGTTMNNIAHPTRFLVIGPDVTVRGMYRGNEPGEVLKMVTDLRAWMPAEK